MGNEKKNRTAAGPAALLSDPSSSEYDVPYYVRCSIDLNIRVGHWYTCSVAAGEVQLKCVPSALLDHSCTSSFFLGISFCLFFVFLFEYLSFVVVKVRCLPRVSNNPF